MVSEVKRRGVQESKNIDYAKQHHTSHCRLPAKVMYPANSTKFFSCLNRSTSTLLMKNVQVYETWNYGMPYYMHCYMFYAIDVLLLNIIYTYLSLYVCTSNRRKTRQNDTVRITSETQRMSLILKTNKI